MARTRNPVPSYLLHKQSGKARAVWTDAAGQRRERLLPGPHNSQESREAFRRLALEIAASPLHTLDSDASTIAELLLAYVQFAEGHYRFPDGTPTSEIFEVKIVVKAVRELYGDKPVAEFGPLAVKAIRQRWVEEGRSRVEVNRRVGIIKRFLKWGLSEELVPAAVYQAVAAVAGLQRGRTTARECEPIGPVDDERVDKTLPHLGRHVRGLVEFQRLTGCRPGEACRLRRVDIDMGGEVWLYRPPHHKNIHRGMSRTIAIGPKAQQLLREFFTPNIDDYLFSPRRALEELRGKPVVRKKRPLGERYDRTSYTRAVSRACEAAFAEPGELDQREGESRKDWKARVKDWRRVNGWRPNQLRHSHGTKVRKLFGLEHAGAALGHSKMATTEVYAERDSGLAAEVARRLG